MDDEGLRLRFRRRRRVLQGSIVTCIVCALASSFVADGPARDVLQVLAVAGFVLPILLYERFGNRCPRCERSFSEAPEVGDEETRGLPILNPISRCPFCKLDLGGR